MGGFGSVWHWVIVLAVVVLLFGAKKIPELAKGLGSGIKNFKKAVKEDGEEEEIQNIEKNPTITRKRQITTKQVAGEEISNKINAPKKRGRKPKPPQANQAEIAQGPKKRGRKPKSQTTL